MKMTHHGHIALVTWLTSVALSMVGGLFFAVAEHLSLFYGIYWAMTTVTTVGYGDVIPHTAAGYIIATATMALAIPIWSLAVAFATSWVTSWHIWESHNLLRTHVTNETSTPGTAWHEAAGEGYNETS